MGSTTDVLPNIEYRIEYIILTYTPVTDLFCQQTKVLPKSCAQEARRWLCPYHQGGGVCRTVAVSLSDVHSDTAVVNASVVLLLFGEDLSGEVAALASNSLRLRVDLPHRHERAASSSFPVGWRDIRGVEMAMFQQIAAFTWSKGSAPPNSIPCASFFCSRCQAESLFYCCQSGVVYLVARHVAEQTLLRAVSPLRCVREAEGGHVNCVLAC